MTGDIHRHESARSTDAPRREPRTASEEGGVRLHRRLAVAVVVATALILCIITHGYWLPSAAEPLLARPIPPDFAPSAIWLHSGDGHSLPGQDTLNLLANLQHRYSAEILVTVGRRSRVVEIGALPPMDELIRRAASRRGIPADRVVGVPYQGAQLWDAADWIQGYLKRHPQAQVLFLCENFAGASVERVFDSAFDGDCRGRVAVLGVPDRRFDAARWWRTRAGVKALMNGYLFGVHGLLQPHPPDPPELTLEQLMDRFARPDGGVP